MSSGVLSIFLACVACVFSAMLVRKRLMPVSSIGLVLLLLPTTINETKATLVFLPLGLMAAFLTAAAPGRRLRNVVLGTAVMTVFIAAFVPIYNYMESDRKYGASIEELISDPERLERNLSYGKDVGSTGEAGKLESVVVPLRRLSRDPLNFLFGYGIGNVSNSALGPGFTGRYFRSFMSFQATSFAGLVLELGVLGMGLVLALMWMVYGDARAVARRGSGLMPAFAAGFTGVVVVMIIAIPYTNIVSAPSLSFLFWYLAGLVAADRMRHAVATRSARNLETVVTPQVRAL